jgi:hypothetical protein
MLDVTWDLEYMLAALANWQIHWECPFAGRDASIASLRNPFPTPLANWLIGELANFLPYLRGQILKNGYQQNLYHD